MLRSTQQDKKGGSQVKISVNRESMIENGESTGGIHDASMRTRNSEGDATVKEGIATVPAVPESEQEHFIVKWGALFAFCYNTACNSFMYMNFATAPEYAMYNTAQHSHYFHTAFRGTSSTVPTLH